MASLRADVSELYVAFFGRPAEPAGAEFWNDYVVTEQAAGRNIDAVEQDLAARFAESEEAKDLYNFLKDPGNGDLNQFVDAIYQNLFNRPAEDAGQQFWQTRFQDQLAQGVPVERAASRFVLEVLNAARDADAKAVQNKAQVATEFSEGFIEAGAVFTVADDLPAAQDLIADTGAGAASLQQARADLAAILDANTTQDGVVTDGYVAGATVFADRDGDGERDPGEPATTTGSQGNFTFTDDAGEPVAVGGPIVARGGTDITTGLDVAGTLRAPEGASTVSPLTALVSNVQQNTGTSAEDAETRVKQALGLGEEVDLNAFDPVAVLGDASASDAQKQAALAVQAATAQVVSLTSTAGAAAAGATGNGDANAGTDQALAAIAQLISDRGEGGTVDLADAETLGNIVRETLSRAQRAGGASLDEERLASIFNNAGELVRTANQRIREASEQGGEPGEALQTIARVQKLAQGEGADSVRQAAQTDNFDQTNARFGGDGFDDRLAETDVDVPALGDDGSGTGGSQPAPDRTEIDLDAQGTDLQAEGGRFLFVEDATRPSDVTIQNFASDDRITFDDPAFVGFTSTAADLLIDVRGPQDEISEIRLVDVLDGEVVSDEASAEAALGFDAFRVPDDAAPTGPVGGTTVRLDEAAAPIDASGRDVRFVEDGVVTSDVVIENFAAGDTIEIQAADFVGFTSTAADILIDVRGPDDQISEIRLVGVNDGSVVADEASAEAVLGFDAFSIA